MTHTPGQVLETKLKTVSVKEADKHSRIEWDSFRAAHLVMENGKISMALFTSSAEARKYFICNPTVINVAKIGG
jgi:hypothetical protein